MRRAAVLLATMMLAVVLASGAAQAIINGQPDVNRHPYVGMVYSDEGRCSGTLISPTVVLTAGHCIQARLTEGTSEEELPVYVTFEQNADRDPDDAYVGTPVTHPDYDGFFPDVGVVILEDPVQEVTTYGKLPEANLVAGLEKGASLTAVGYGVQDFEVGSGPPRPTGELTRYKATVRYLGTNGVDNGFGRHRFIKTKEGSAGQGGEGTCFGDSGGPYFLNDQRTIVAVTSFGLNPVCAGVGYAQRIDLPVVRNWVRSFL
jgi:hypothetical protein